MRNVLLFPSPIVQFGKLIHGEFDGVDIRPLIEVDIEMVFELARFSLDIVSCAFA